MNSYVITYTELAQYHEVIWYGKTPQDALITFWDSYDYDDAKNVSNVEIYFLTKVPVATSYEEVVLS